MGVETPIAEIIIEREFGSENFLELYSCYVSKKIIELLEKEKDSDDARYYAEQYDGC